LKKYFKIIHIANINDDFHYSFQRCAKDYSIHRIEIETPGLHTFSISQKGEKMFPKDSNYQFSMVRAFILKANEFNFDVKSIQYVMGKTSVLERDTYL
jgi:hypothetical protein